MRHQTSSQASDCSVDRAQPQTHFENGDYPLEFAIRKRESDKQDSATCSTGDMELTRSLSLPLSCEDFDEDDCNL